jgi:hypothetical protein
VTDQEKQKADELISRLELSVGQIFPRDGGNAALLATMIQTLNGLRSLLGLVPCDDDPDAQRSAQPPRPRPATLASLLWRSPFRAAKRAGLKPCATDVKSVRSERGRYQRPLSRSEGIGSGSVT